MQLRQKLKFNLKPNQVNEKMKMERLTTADSIDHFISIYLIGRCGVGKSSLCKRFDTEDFSEHYQRTCGFDLIHLVNQIEHEVIKMQIWDAAGEAEYKESAVKTTIIANVVFLMFDVTDQSSIDYLKKWKEKNVEYVNKDTFYILVGTKCEEASEQVISQSKIEELTDELGCDGLAMISAKNNMNVSELFYQTMTLYLAKKIKLNKLADLDKIKELAYTGRHQLLFKQVEPELRAKKKESDCCLKLKCQVM